MCWITCHGTPRECSVEHGSGVVEVISEDDGCPYFGIVIHPTLLVSSQDVILFFFGWAVRGRRLTSPTSPVYAYALYTSFEFCFELRCCLILHPFLMSAVGGVPIIYRKP